MKKLTKEAVTIKEAYKRSCYNRRSLQKKLLQSKKLTKEAVTIKKTSVFI